jgi:FdhE protein
VSEPVLSGGGSLGAAAYLRPHPGPALFSRRAARFEALAPGHAAGEYLAFLARVATAQHEAAERLWAGPPPRLPPSTPGGRPLDAAGPRPASWLAALTGLLASLEPAPLPGPARATLRRLADLPTGALEGLADRVLAGALRPGEVAEAPLVGAALQVAFGDLASRRGAGTVPRADDEGCPVCGFPPVTGLVLGDDKLRYLTCGLCASQWHHTRVQCTRCRSAARLSYLVQEGSDGAAKAEVCEGCHAYLKLIYLEERPGLDPWADDLATLPLDLLVAERGLERLGVNLLLAAGDEGARA